MHESLSEHFLWNPFKEVQMTEQSGKEGYLATTLFMCVCVCVCVCVCLCLADVNLSTLSLTWLPSSHVAYELTQTHACSHTHTLTHTHAHTHTRQARPGHTVCCCECPGLETQQKQTAPKYHCRVPMSTRADATLIQSAMESHRAEWLWEGPASESCCGRVQETPGTSADIFFFFSYYGSFRRKTTANVIFQMAKDISVGWKVKERIVPGYSNRELLLLLPLHLHACGSQRCRLDCDDVTELQSFAVTLVSKLTFILI